MEILSLFSEEIDMKKKSIDPTQHWMFRLTSLRQTSTHVMTNSIVRINSRCILLYASSTERI